MDEAEQRQLARDSLFVMADLRLEGSADEHRIKVRNLSSGGMMGEGTVRVVRGASLQVHIRNIGWVEGSIAWVQEDRFGIAFRQDIDPKVARSSSPPSEHSPRFTRPPLPDFTPSGLVRKI
jgi:hypothetical protein